MKKRFLTFILTIATMLMCIFGFSACGGNVEFKINFVVENEVYATISTSGNEVISMPENPTKDDYTFDGWYWDENTWEKPFTANSLLDAPLSSDMKVYAKFNKNHTHEYTPTTTEPTCTEKGIITYTCTCGDSYTEDIPATGEHTWDDGKITTEPTCTEKGVKTFTCTVCETTTYTEDVEALTHDEKTHEAKAPTCTEIGWNEYVTCERDGCEYSTYKEIPATGVHTWDKGEETKAPTCTKEGEMTYTCTVCKTATKTEPIDKLPHEHAEEWTSNATHHWHECVCGDKKDETKHTAGAPATATTPQTCTVCGYVLQAETGILFNTLTVDGTKVYGKVSNDTEIFSFINEITVKGDATYVVDVNMSCKDPIESKTVELSVGDNKFYVLEKIGNNVKLFTVTIRRRPMYEVTFNANGGTAVDKQVIEEDYLATEPETTRTGYTFTGWDYDFTQAITQTTKITASWDINVYNITYELNGGENHEDNVATYTIETVTITLQTPTRTGYTFNGWFTEETFENQVTEIALGSYGHKTFYAKWTPTEYNVTYVVNKRKEITFDYNYSGVDPTTVTLFPDEILAYPAEPSRSGYIFRGWFLDAACTQRFSFNEKIEGDLTLYAGWQAHYTNGYSHTNINPINYNSSSNSYSISAGGTSSSSQRYIYLVAKESGTHKIYYKNSSSSSYNYTYIGATNVTAGKTIKSTSYCSSTSYKYVSFTCSAGDVICINIYRYNTSSSSNYGTAYFYFEGFTNTESTACSSGIFEYVTYNIETPMFDLITPTMAGYTFNGWFTEETFENQVTEIPAGSHGDKFYYAKWTANTDTKYTVIYYWQNIEDDNYTPHESIELTGTTDTPTAEVEIKEYTHFTYNASKSKISGNINGDGGQVLSVYYTRDSYTISTARNNTKAGTVTGSGTYRFDKEITLTATTNTGYTWLGWYDGETLVCETEEFTFKAEKNVTYTATWSTNVYNIMYELNGGENHEDNPDTYTIETATITLQTPTRMGYTFGGWFAEETFENQVAEITLGSYEHKTFYAKWTPTEYTVTYHHNDSTAKEITSNSYTITNNSSSRWTESSGVLKSTNKTDSSSSVYKIVANENIIVSFEYKVSSEKNYDKLIIAKNGTALETVSGSTSYVAYSVTLNAGEYLTFTYFKDGSQKSGDDCAYIKNLTYAPNGAVEKVTTQNYNIETLTFALITPTRAGYTFNGWFTEETFENQVREIPVGSYGDKVYYAKWSANTDTKYTVIYYLQNLDDNNYTLHESVELEGETDTPTAEVDIKEYTHFTYNASKSVISGNINGDGGQVLSVYYTRDSYTISTARNNTKAGTVTASGTYKFDKQIMLTATTNAGYTWLGWYDGETLACETEEFTFKAEKDVTYTATWTANTDTKYTVNYYLQNLDDNNYTLHETVELEGETDTPTAEVDIKEYTHFTYNANKSVVSGNIDGDGSRVLSVYYTRDSYSIVVNANNAKAGTSTQIKGTYKYDKEFMLTATTNAGYTWLGWYDGETLACETEEFTFKAEKDVTYTATWVANTDTKYTVNYYLQNLDDNEYTLHESVELEGETDTTATAGIKEYTHFTYNASKSVISGNIDGDGSRVLSVYYTRNTYTLSIDDSNAGFITNSGTYKYGNIEMVSEVTTYIGYEFVGWYCGEELLSADSTYTFIVDKNITAKFAVKTEISNFNFTSTATSCQITGIKDKTVTEIVVPDYVTSISQGAFSGCSSLESITIPFVGGSRKTTTDTYQYPFGYIFGTSSYTGGTATKQYYYGSNTSSTTYTTYYIPTSLKSVTVTGGNILYGAFRNCDSLTSVVIGDSVETIGDSAFAYCSNLTSVVINSGSIGSYAFAYCSNLTSVEIPGSVTSIGSGAFSGCRSLEKMTIPFVGAKAGVTASDTYQYPFGYIFGTSSYTGGTKTEQYYYGSSTSSTTSTHYYIPTSLKSVTITGGNILYGAFENCSSLTSVEIGDSVTSIGGWAFSSCDSLTSVEIGDGVTSIGSYAFNSCGGLTSVEIGDGVTSIGSYAFRYCSSLTSVEIPDSVTSIGSYAFYYCSSLTSVVINSGSIGSYAFYYCDGLTSVEIGDSVTSIGEKAFYNCSKLTSIVISDSVESIGSYAFDDCDSLTYNIKGGLKYLGNENNPYLYLADTTSTAITTATIDSNCKFIAQGAFYNCSKLTSIIIPDSVTSIGDYAFSYCSSLTSIYITDIAAWCNIEGLSNIMSSNRTLYLNGEEITELIIPDSVTEIKPYAFYYCSSLTSVEIGDSVESIGSYAFRYCSSLTSVEIGDGVTSIGSYAFRNCSSLTSVEIPDSVTSIGSYAFSYCESLTSVVIGDSVESIGYWAFDCCDNLAEIEVDEDNEKYQSIEGNLYTKDGKTLIQYAIGKTATEFIIPDSVTSIGEEAFYNCSKLTSVVIPDSVTSIGSGAFSGCRSLEKMTIPFVGAKAGVTASDTYQYPFGYIFGTSSYTGGTKTEQYYYGSSTSNTTYTYYYIPTSLKSVTITGGNILYGAFYNCSSLTSVVIGNSVESIGYDAFYACHSLARVYITDLAAWCNISFENAYANPLSAGVDLYLNNEFLTELVIPETVTEIKPYAFHNCDSLTSVEIPDSVTSIGDYAFSYCSSLTSVEIPDSVTSIGERAFEECSSLTSIIVSEDNTAYQSIDGNLYSKDGTILIQYALGKIETTFEIPDSVTTIGEWAFSSCSSLTSVEIGDSVESIGYQAFYYCDSLTSVVIGDGVTSIGNGAFFGCSKLQFKEYGNCKYLGNSDNEYYALIEVKNKDYSAYTIHEDTKVIAGCAFYQCSGVTSITIPDNVVSIGSDAFYDCTSLTSIYITDIAAWCNIEGLYYLMTCIDNKKTLYLNGEELTELIIPDSVTDIKPHAFAYCSNLTSVVIGDSVTSIGNGAFAYCSNLTSVVIGDSVTSIGNGAFYNCYNLKNVVIGDSVTSIGSLAFYNCNNLTSVVIGDSVKTIGEYAFNSCDGLTSVVIGDSVTTIGEAAFWNCKSLTSVVIPDSVETIGNGAFKDCTSLRSVYYKGGAEDWAQIEIIGSYNSKLTNATRYYYSETEPTTSGKYWHYDENDKIAVW